MTGKAFRAFFIARHGEHQWAIRAGEEIACSRFTCLRLAISAKIPDKYAAKVEKLKGNKP